MNPQQIKQRLLQAITEMDDADPEDARTVCVNYESLAVVVDRVLSEIQLEN